MWGYTTAIVAAAAIMASRAFPPSLKTANADSDAKEWGATAMPRIPHFCCMLISPLKYFIEKVFLLFVLSFY
jgi:hypothetical protein